VIGSILRLISLQLMNMSDDKRTFALVLSLFSGFFVTSIILASTRILPERMDYQGRGGKGIYKSFIDVFKNKHALLLLIVFAIETFGTASVGMLVPYLAEYVIPMQALMVPVLVTYTVPQFIFTPFWIKLAKIYGKKRLWAFAMWLNAATFFGFFFIISPGETSLWIWVFAFALGFAAGCGAVVAPAIKADIIDYDEYLTGERKEGAYLAVWNLVRKSAASVTALVTWIVLQLTGFEPNMEQSMQTQDAMRALFALLPCICYVIGALLFIRFNFNEREHAEVREILAQRILARESESTSD
jgi:GPH family glycoside/pentoside/hexuronide:cation symporter